MRVIKSISTVVIVLAILGFSLQNMTMTQVQIFRWQSGEIPMYLLVYLSFALGMLMFPLVAGVRFVKQKKEIYEKKREIKNLKDEIKKLRQSESRGISSADKSEDTTNPSDEK